jgi:putative ABC transport system permease protein
MFVPYITKVFLKIFERIYGFIFGNEGILAVKNLNDNKNILNNISLLAIGISALLMINTISNSVGIEVLNAYKDWKFDIMVSLNGADRNAEQVLRSVEGVGGTYGAFEAWEGIQVVDTQYKLGYLQGVDIKKYREYVTFRMEGSGDVDEVFRQLDEGRNIMVAYMAKEKLDLEIGDPLTLEMTSGNKTYRVIGFYDSIMQNGSNAIISQKYFKMDMEQSYFDNFYIRTSKDPDEVLLSIQEKFMRRGVSGDTIVNMEKANYDANNQFMIILQAFSVIAMLIGIFGIFNNYMISFIERKRSIAILRSVGLSKKQMLKMIMIEALTGGCIGGIVGIIGGILMLSAVPHLMEAIDIPLALHYTWSFFINSLVGGIIIAVLASISPALKTTKLNIIDAIKYE